MNIKTNYKEIDISKGKGDKIDIYIGKQIVKMRESLGISRYRLAQLIDLSHQQVGKYEQGINRVSSGRLYQISRVLDKKLDDFFDQY